MLNISAKSSFYGLPSLPIETHSALKNHIGDTCFVRHMIKAMLIFYMVFLSLLAIAESDEKALAVGTEIGFAPYADVDADGRPIGFSVDLFTAVARAMNIPVQYRVSSWDEAWTGLVEGRLDALPVVAKLKEREEYLEYTSTHTQGFDAFFVRSRSQHIDSIEQARGFRIAVMRQDVAHHVLTAKGFEEQLTMVDTLVDAMRLLATDKVDAVLAPMVQGTIILQEKKLADLVERGAPLKEYQRNFAFAVKKGNFALRDRLEQGLAVVKASGQYQHIYDHWLGIYNPPKYDPRKILWWVGGFVITILMALAWIVVLRRGRLQAQMLATTLEKMLAEQRRIEAELRDALARSRSYFSQNMIGAAITSPEKGWVEVNDRLCDILGRSREEVLQSTWSEMTHPDDLQADVAKFDRVLAGEIDGYSLEKRFVSKSGAEVACNLSVSCIRDEPRNVRYFVALVEDVSERKAVERALSETTDRHRLLFETAPPGILCLNDEGVIIEANAAAGRILGSNAESLLGLSSMDENWRVIRENGTVFPINELPTTVAVRDGKAIRQTVMGVFNRSIDDYVWIRLDTVPIPSPNKTGRREVYILFEDISEQHRIEALSRLQIAALKAADNAIMITDRTGKVEWANPAMAAMSGYSVQEMIGHTPGQLMKSNVQDEVFYRKLWETILANRVWRGEITNRRRDGTLYAEYQTITPVADESGSIHHFVAIKMDVTEQHAIQHQLREAEERWQFALEGGGQGVWDWNVQTGHVYFSPRWKSMLGYAEGEISEAIEEWEDRVHPDDAARVEESLAQHLSGTTPEYQTEHRVRSKGNGYVWILDRGKVIQWAEDGSPLRMIGTHTDISAQIRRETELATARDALEVHQEHLEHMVNARTAELLSAEEKLHQILDATGDGIVGVNSDGDITFANPSALKLLGYEAAALIGKNLHETVHHSHESGLPYPQSGCPIESVLLGDITVERDDEVFWTSSGDALPVNYSARSIIREGVLSGAVVSFQNITERKQAESALRESESRFRQVADSAPVLIWMAGVDKGCNYFNQSWLDFTGRAPDQEVGNGWVAGVHPDDRSRCLEIYSGAFDRREFFSMTYRLRRHDGEYRWILDSGTPRFDGDGGNFIGYIGSCIDIDDIKAAEMAREAALVEAERLAHVKSEFLANMSHEIRTPLNGVLGLAQIGLRDSQGGPAQIQFRKILESGKLLLGVINDILDFSKIEAGKLAIESVPVDLQILIQDVVETFRQTTDKKQVTLSHETAPDFPAFILSDPVRLTQILINLLSNAVKFTEHGSVRLHVSRENNVVLVRVVDTGIGMSDEQISRLFTPFEQADGSTTRRFGGTGLGLAITSRLVSLMDGSISVLSRPGEGTTFEVRMPLHVTQSATTSSVALPAVARGRRLSGIRILAAEDNEVNQMVLEDLLLSEGADCVFVSNGQLAVDAVAKQGPFDVVLMDVQMPVLDGLGATRMIRRIAPDLRVIGQTAHALKVEHEKCLAAGMVDLVVKPIDHETLLDKVLKYAKTDANSRNKSKARQLVRDAGLPPFAGVSVCVDWPELNKRFPGRGEFVLRLINVAIESNTPVPARLRQLSASANLVDIAAVAHSLKGLGGNMVAARLAELAQQTERLARRGENGALDKAVELAQVLEGFLIEIGQYRDNLTVAAE